MRSRLGPSFSMTFGGTAGAVSAALASVGLIVLSALYLLPLSVIACSLRGGASPPAITAGGAYFSTPPMTRVTVQSGGEVAIGDEFVPPAQLEERLRAIRTRMPHRSLELIADKHLTLGQLAPALAAMRRAGYGSFYVFGRESTVLELMSSRYQDDSQFGRTRRTSR